MIGSADLAIFLHQVEHHAGAADRGLGIGGGGIAGRRLHQAGDDRRLGQVQALCGMAEEFAAGGVDAIGPATEIDLVEIEFQDLLLGEFALQRHRQHHLADLAAPAIAVVEEDVARNLLGDGRRPLPAPAAAAPFQRDPGRACHADRIDAGVHVETAILGRHHRIDHDRGDLVIAQPATEARPQGDDDRSVRRMDADHLAIGGGFEAVIIG